MANGATLLANCNRGCYLDRRHYARGHPPPFDSRIMPLNHANSRAPVNSTSCVGLQLIGEIKLAATVCKNDGEGRTNGRTFPIRGLFVRNYRFPAVFLPYCRIVLFFLGVNNGTARDSKGKREREKKELGGREKWKWNSPWWKVERESCRARSWHDELESGDRCNRMLARYHVWFYAVDLVQLRVSRVLNEIGLEIAVFCVESDIPFGIFFPSACCVITGNDRIRVR